MVGVEQTTYGRASLLAVAWLVVIALLAVGGAWLCRTFDPAGHWRDSLRGTVLVILALLPMLAGAVHRSVRVVTLTAFFEALSLGMLMLFLVH